MARRWIMHVDMDAFYASVEQRDHPEWQGKPIIVGSRSARGVVATASYEARAYGVHSAMASKVAAAKCPQAVFVKPRMEVYRAVSEQIHEVLLGYAPGFEPLSLDEAFLDVTGMGTRFATLGELGRAVRQAIFDKTKLTASIGIAPNKFLAKLASDWQKPNGLVIIPYGKERELIAPLPVRRLWGVGPKAAAVMESEGWQTIGDVANANRARLVELFGVQGNLFYELAHGRDDRPLEINAVRKSIGEEETYPQDLHDEEQVDIYLARYCDLVARRLRDKGLRARTVTLKVRFGSYRTLTRSRTVGEPMDLQQELYMHIKKLYNGITKTEGIRLLGVTASGLVPAVDELNLFPDERDRQRKAAQVADVLRAKYGKDVVQRGFWWETAKDKEEEV